MLTIEEIKIPGYEKIIEGKDPSRGLHCYIAIHNSKLGPALGGTRIHNYNSASDALQDVLKLSKTMTYKSAAVKNRLGGGKSVIIADPIAHKTLDLLHAFAEVVDSLQGKYIAAEDMGTTPSDMTTISQRTSYVSATTHEMSSGDPSPFTAYGVFQGIRAVAKKLWGNDNLQGRTIAIQGLGSTGLKLAQHLFWSGVRLIVCDIDQQPVLHAIKKYGAKSVSPEDIFSVECDILAPCAFGGIINPETIPLLRCKAIAGAANNQLSENDQCLRLQERNILYAPDYIINAGGIINIGIEFEPGGYDPMAARAKTSEIYDLLSEIFDVAETQGKPTIAIADEIAERYISGPK